MSTTMLDAGECQPSTVKPLIGGVEPFLDECLMSVMARTAAKNVFPRVRQMLASARIKVQLPEFIAFSRTECAPALSQLLSIDEKLIVRMMHPAVRPDRPADKVNWYGTSLPRKFISTDRRFSPTSFASSEYIRATWQVRPITFCPESMELLITHCAYCGVEVGWRVGQGFHLCESCGRSLRRSRPGKVEWGMRSDARDAARLVNPNPEVRAAVLKKLPLPFCDWDAGDVFVGVLEMGLAFSFPDREAHKSISRSTGSGDYSSFKVDHLVAGYRAMLRWPESFREFLPQVLSDKWGDMHQRMGPFAKYFLWNGNYKRPIADLLREEVKRTLTESDLIPFGGNGIRAKWMKRDDRLTRNAAGKRFGIEPKMVGRLASDGRCVIRLGVKKDRIFYDPELLGPSVQIYKSSVSAAECGSKIGVPAFCVAAIAQNGLVTAESDHDATLMAQTPLYNEQSVTRLANDLRELPLRGSRGRSLTWCMEGQFHPQTWADAIGALVRGEIGVTRMPERNRAPLAKVTVSVDDFEVFASRLPARSVPEDVTVPSVTAGLLLGIPGGAVARMIKLDLIRASFRKRVGIIRLSDLAAFSDQYVLGGEGDLRSGRRGFSAQMRANGFEPVAVVGKCWIWSREEAEMYLRSQMLAHSGAAGAGLKRKCGTFRDTRKE